MNLVEFASVTKRYQLGDVEVVALDGVSFAVQPGDFVAITGPSGSGKTTMLNLIGCLDAPSSGEMRVMGKAVSSLDEQALDQLRSRTFGMIFQNFNLIPVLTAEENVALPLHLHGLSRQEMRKRSQDALRAVGLERFAGFRPDQLSGGQRQRVAVARALVTRPQLILADEPTASLDTTNAIALVELMKQLNADHGVTFVFSTHDDRLLQHVRRIVELRDGKLSVTREHAAHQEPASSVPQTDDQGVL
ncbi:ABC transporter ATP-binding protein [Chromobacterium sphagni]|uniref:Lipoprotein ABC transporter ATP-binding protein LolD n=1 Tax=Chromobacterium sphagni TaxID=1903179 RepID=A0A1S1X2J9_9NEIS|nr:ABC transporter ATP-binding protein [Chromobacterium sphagni]OHX13426.1 lipoprotein ABC transporter ATP-binding protein LolD [Chromobacterium sphagni]OHX21883.1 lipoprotein ABC transporter ATP-binding protein LolD [Chromobacterium sphagni]